MISNELVDAFLGVSRAPIASAAAASRAGGARHGRGGNRDDDDDDDESSSGSTRKSSGVSAFSYKSAGSAAAGDFERRSPSKSRSTLTIRRAGKFEDDDY